jgi:hypothetical protein
MRDNSLKPIAIDSIAAIRVLIGAVQGVPPSGTPEELELRRRIDEELAQLPAGAVVDIPGEWAETAPMDAGEGARPGSGQLHTCAKPRSDRKEAPETKKMG